MLRDRHFYLKRKLGAVKCSNVANAKCNPNQFEPEEAYVIYPVGPDPPRFKKKNSIQAKPDEYNGRMGRSENYSTSFPCKRCSSLRVKKCLFKRNLEVS